jgi:hypothetical protein
MLVLWDKEVISDTVVQRSSALLMAKSTQGFILHMVVSGS